MGQQHNKDNNVNSSIHKDESIRGKLIKQQLINFNSDNLGRNQQISPEMKQEITSEQKEGENIMLKDSIPCKVMASTGGNSESTIPQGRQKQSHAEIKSVFSRKQAGEQHKHGSQRREDVDCNYLDPYQGERDTTSNCQDLETNSKFISANKIKKIILNIWRMFLNGDAFKDAENERKYIQEQLDGTAESFMSIQICYASTFLVLSVINLSEQHFGETSTDDSLGQSIAQILITVIDLIVIVIGSKVKFRFMWRVCIVTWQLTQSVYLEQILFGDLNQILYQGLSGDKCWNEGGSNTFELKYQMLKGISVVFNSFFLLRNLQAWNYRLILSVLLIVIYSVILFHHCSFWVYIITLFLLTLLFLYYQFQEELRQRNRFKSRLLESYGSSKGTNSPSLYSMVHEQISSGIIVVQRSNLIQSDLSLQFANKISIKQLNCHNENEILMRFKEIFIPLPGMSSSPNPNLKQTNSLYDMLMNYLDQITRNGKKSSVSNNYHKEPSNSSPQKHGLSSVNSFKPQMIDNPTKRKLLTIKKTNSLVQISKPDSSVRIRLNSLGMQPQLNGRRSSQPQNYGIAGSLSKPNTISDNSSLLHQPVLNLSAIQEHHSFKPSSDSIATPSSLKHKLGAQQKSINSEQHNGRNSFTDGKLIYGVLKSVQKHSTSQQKIQSNDGQKESQPDLCDPIEQEKESQESEEEQSEELHEEDELDSPSMVQVQLTDSEKLFRQFDFKINQIEWDNQPALIILVTDSTQKLINEKLKELEMYKEELLYTMQHISRTPLNSIINISEILLSQYFKQYNKTNFSNRIQEDYSHLANRQKEIDQLEDIVQSLHIIKNNGYILLHTINTVTDLSTFQTNQGKLDIDSQVFSIKEVLDEIQDLYLHQIQEKKLTFTVTISTPSDLVNSDKKRITQLLFEVIGNAIKYTQSGFVHVKIKEQEKGLFWVKVQDSGEGMSEEHKRNLFCNSVIQYCQRERDFSKKTSTGLGLDFSRKIVGILGPFYQIFVKSMQRQGSTFKFLLFQDFDARKTIDILSLKARIIMMNNQPPDQGGGIFTPDLIEKMATTENNNNNSKYSHKIYNQQNNNNSSSTQIQISSNIGGAKTDYQNFKKLNASPKIQFSNMAGTPNYPQYPCENQGDDMIEVGAESISNFHLATNNNRNSINSGKAILQFQSQQISLILGKKDNNLFQSEIKEEKSNISLLKHSPNLQLQKYTSLDYDNNQRYIFPQSANYNNRRSQFEIDLGHSTILNQSIQKPLIPRKKSKQLQNIGQLSNISSHIFTHILPSDKKIPIIEITDDVRAKYHAGAQENKQVQCIVDESQHRSQISSPSNNINDSVGSKYSPIQLTQHEMICQARNDLNLLSDTPHGIPGDSIENMLQKHQNYELNQNSYFKSPYLQACSSKSVKKTKISEMPFSQHKWRYPMHPRAELNKLQNRNDLVDDESDNFASIGDASKQLRNSPEVSKERKVLPISPYKREIEKKRNLQRSSSQICQTLKIDDFEGKLWKIFNEKCCILGIDDNVFNLNILEMVFKKCTNVVFHKACNGQECLDKAILLKQQQNQSYKIFLIDIQMPIMDGYKAHEELKILMKKKVIDYAPVFAVTAYANEKAICLQQGMEGFVEKPINMKILVSLIYDYFFNLEDLQMQQRHYINQYLQNHSQ